MKFILDTNIVLSYAMNKQKILDYIDSIFTLFADENFITISVITVGELYSIALQRNWGKQKNIDLNRIINKLFILDINHDALVKRYAEIDAYSQGKLANKPLPPGVSARNMGKNDLWIAATASVTNATLITTDNDFEHLNNTFLNLFYIDISKFV